MIKYYTRACNFYYGNIAKDLIKKKKALPLCGNQNIAFDKIELIKRNHNKVDSKILTINNIKNFNIPLKKKINLDLNNITKRRKNFLENINFIEPTIMGILNLTPDSFSDGGKFNSYKNANKHIIEMINYGAKIIDVGGESTRPGSKTISSDIEWKRIKNIVKNFKKNYKQILLSVDTRKFNVMNMSLRYQTDIINDVSGFDFDQESLSFIKNQSVSKVIHHMKGTPNNMQNNPKYKNVLLDIYDYFENKIYNFKDKKIILDPGIGFGKNLKHNLTLISNISLFHSLGFPILIGTSRKRFINQISGKYDSKDRLGGTLASILFLLLQGIQIFRVHNVNEVKQGILVFKKILLN